MGKYTYTFWIAGCGKVLFSFQIRMRFQLLNHKTTLSTREIFQLCRCQLIWDLRTNTSWFKEYKSELSRRGPLIVYSLKLCILRIQELEENFSVWELHSSLDAYYFFHKMQTSWILQISMSKWWNKMTFVTEMHVEPCKEVIVTKAPAVGLLVWWI